MREERASARLAQTHSCCFCSDRCSCVCAPHCHTTATHNHTEVILGIRVFTVPYQSIEIVFTLHITGHHTSSQRFLPRNANTPHSWTLFDPNGGLTCEHTHTHTRMSYPTPNDLLPRIHRVSAVSSDDDDDFARSFSLLLFPTMLLTLDHWTKIDSTAAA